MHRALVAFCKEHRRDIKAIVSIGDMMDFPSISRWQRIGWEHQPKVAEEIEGAQDRLHEVEGAAGRVPKVWCLGNHDARFETRLANRDPEFAKVHGVHLKDHFPLWAPCWAAWINNGELVAKHRFKSGKYAPYNDALYSGKNMAVGDKHSAKVMPITDLDGTRWGTDVGCIADVWGEQFVNYTEDNPKDWRSAFGVFTFKDGRMMQPELVMPWDEDRVQFRGSVFTP
jgi:hypothetical protein